MDKGQEVVVTEYGGGKLLRVVVADLGASVVVCNEAEWEKAAREKREPGGVGFPRSDVSVIEQKQNRETGKTSPSPH